MGMEARASTLGYLPLLTDKFLCGAKSRTDMPPRLRVALSAVPVQSL